MCPASKCFIQPQSSYAMKHISNSTQTSSSYNDSDASEDALLIPSATPMSTPVHF